MWLLLELSFAFATAVVTMTLVKAKVFLPLRIWINNRSSFFGEMINCTYCTSHWVAGLLAFIEVFWVTFEVMGVIMPWQLALFAYYHPVLTWFLATCVNIALAAPIMLMMYSCHQKMGPIPISPKERPPSGPTEVKRVRSIESE